VRVRGAERRQPGHLVRLVPGQPQRRLLRYLREPAAGPVLTAADRRALERLCGRLPLIIPAMPAVLTRRDLWSGNLLSRDGGEIAVIDPAASFAWAETNLSML